MEKEKQDTDTLTGALKPDEEANKQVAHLLATQNDKLDAQAAQIEALVSKINSIAKKKSPVRDLFRSKKAIATIVGLLAPILLNVFGLDLSTEEVTAFVGLIAAYVVGQGVADHGKEKEKVRVQHGASSKAS